MQITNKTAPFSFHLGNETADLEVSFGDPLASFELYPRCFTALWLPIRMSGRKWRAHAGRNVSVAGRR
jgi:hypothetical protein